MQPKFTPNPLRIVGDVAYVGLADRAGNIGSEAMVDAADAERVIASGRWSRVRRPDGDFYATSYSLRCLLHRFVIDASGSVLVDHINHQTLDCRRSNLRLVDGFQNMQNRRGASRHSQSGVRGVYWEERTQAWRVQVRAFGQVYRLGRFADLDEAVTVAREGRLRLMTHTAN